MTNADILTCQQLRQAALRLIEMGQIRTTHAGDGLAASVI